MRRREVCKKILYRLDIDTEEPPDVYFRARGLASSEPVGQIVGLWGAIQKIVVFAVTCGAAPGAG